MQYIAFVSTFPNEANMRDGYFRRVHHVDEALAGIRRIHLDIRFAKNFRKQIVVRDPEVQIMHLNAFLHFFLIRSVLKKSGIVYIHSIAKVPSILIQWMNLKNRVPFALDLHGVMVDELRLAGNPLKAWFYSHIEKYCFKHSRLNIYVSQVMQSHYRTKYPYYKGNEVIFSTSLQSPVSGLPSPVSGLQPEACNDVLMLYSGNTQPWQNIDLMLDTMKRLSAPNIKFLILSGQKKYFERLVRAKGIPENKITVISVTPNELESYYKMAHYGFILRDDILVNRVANPTKLAEYLQYGIIPVVRLAEIGDYYTMGYEYVNYESCDNNLKPRKSDRNIRVFQNMSRLYGSEPLKQAVLKTIGNA